MPEALRSPEAAEADPQHSGVLRARSAREMDLLHRFWYRVYVQEMNKHFACADHEAGRLDDGLDAHSTTLYIACQDRVAASLRITWGGGAAWPEDADHLYDLPGFAAWPDEALACVGRVVVDPAWRRSNLVGPLFMEACRVLHASPARFTFSHCAPGLVQMWEQLGLRRYKANGRDPRLGLRVPMVLVLDDAEHLRAVRSPLLRYGLNNPRDAAAPAWFRQNFVTDGVYTALRSLREEAMHDFLHRRAPAQAPLLAGLEPADAAKVLHNAALLGCAPGETVAAPGEAGEEMYMLLAGHAEMRLGGLRLARLGPGECFGETELVNGGRRWAELAAITDAELVIINRRFIEHATERLPKIASRLLLNMARLMGRRLAAAGQGWAQSAEALRERGAA